MAITQDEWGLLERKAVARFLVFKAARATIHRDALPWWSWLNRLKHQWSITSCVVAAAEIERGEQHGEQGQWLNDIDGGEAILRGIERAVHKRSGAPMGLTEDEICCCDETACAAMAECSIHGSEPA